MSNLDELIERLCPDGVEYKEINDCTIKVQNIKWKSYVGEDKQYIDLSSVDRERNIITETQNINADTAPSRAQQIVMKDDIILGTTRPMLKRYCIIPEKYDGEICSTGFCVLRAKTDIINPRWLYHNITTKKFFAYVEKNQQGASYPAISDTIVKAFKLPVPPLEVQREIVRILDNFTFLTAELAAELVARQKQYEYYRDLLLTFKPNESTILNERTNELEINAPVSRLKLGECCVVQSGGTPSKKNADYWVNGKIKWLSSSVCQNKKEVTNITGYITEEGLKHSSAKIMNKGTTLIALVGATIGKRAFLQYEAAINQNIAGIYPKNKNLLLPEYIYYISETLYEKFLGLTNGKLAMANLSFVRNLEIPVPQLEQQQRIVDILDCFDTLCNDISSGLPAEIEARQKQYEYYRDKLLTFKELKKEA